MSVSSQRVEAHIQMQLYEKSLSHTQSGDWPYGQNGG
jgi:hypothetical protein